MWVRWLTGALVLVLGMTVGGAAAVAVPVEGEESARVAWDDPAAGDDADGQGAGPGEVKDDVVSASVTARATGKPVAVASLTDEFSTTVINPDGSFTTETSAGQQRFKGDEGEWVEVDLDLTVRGDGSVGPKAHPLDLSMPADAGAGDKPREAIRVGHPGGGREVTWQLPVKGKPALEGTAARYVNAWPGIDVVVDARRSGFEQTFVVTDARSVGSLPGGEQVSWTVPLLTKGLTARPGDKGVVEFVDAKGKVVSTIVAPVAFDAVVDDRSGLPVNTSEVELKVVPTAGRGKADLVVSVDRAWLTSAERVFPITVDPTYAALDVAPSMDTYILKSATTQTYGSDPELLVGTYNGGTDVARSFVNFPTSSLIGKQIKTASLSLYERHSWSCTATAVGVHATATTVSSSVTWPTRPTFTATAAGSVNAAKGFSSSCPAGRISIPMTSLVQSWAAGSATTKTVMVKAGSETDNFGWKRFSSSEGSHPPVLKTTWNRPPAKPATPVLAASNSSTYIRSSDGAVQTWTASARPRFESSTTDPDQNSVRLTFQVHTANTGVSDATLVATCTSPSGAGGTILGCAPASDLTNHKVYYVRAKSSDLGGMEGSWSGFKQFYVDWTAGSDPTVSCPAPYTDGSWADVAPSANVSCWVSGANASMWHQSVKLEIQVDGGAATTYSIGDGTNPLVTGVAVSVPRTAGGHTIRVVGISRTGVRTSQVLYSFGYGSAGMWAPVGDPRPTVTGVVPVEAVAPPAQPGQSVTAKVKYRTAGSVGGSDENNWFDADETLTVTQVNGQSEAKGNWNTAATAINTNTGADERVPVVLEIQVCFTYGGGVTKCTGEQDARSVFRVPHAFGNGFPVAEAGPGQVALFTGEFNTSVTDVSVPGYVGDMTLSRSHATYGLPDTAAQRVFGPGWVANLDGSDVGLAGTTLIDNTRLDGSIVLVYGDGEAVVFDPPSAETGNYLARTGANLETGDWLPGSEESEESGISLNVTGTGTSTVLKLTDIDGNVTTFTPTTAPSSSAAGVFAPSTVEEIGVPGQMSFTRDSSGRITRIVAPAPTGLTCPGTGAVTAAGCRVLDITYATTTTGSDVAGQIKSVSATLFDPALGANRTVVVATYTYDSNQRLASVTDPRSGLGTTYSYDSAGRLVEVTPPGVRGFVLEYTGGTGTIPAQLKGVLRRSLSGTGPDVRLARFVYGLNPAAPETGLPTLDAVTVAKWGQPAHEVPTYAAAVFGPDRPVDGAITAADWPYADVHYTTARGYTVNSASYGAGQWQVTATGYDKYGNVVRELDALAIAKTAAFGSNALDEGEDPWRPEQVEPFAVTTVYNSTDIVDGDGIVLVPAGALVTDVWDAARTADLPGLGVREAVRAHLSINYDEGAPFQGRNPRSGVGFSLATSVTVTAADTSMNDLAVSGAPLVLFKTVNSYDPVVTGTGSGWEFATPTQVVSGHGGTTSTSVTVLDSEGRVTEQRQPSEAATGTGPGTRRTVYYTADANSIDTACGNKPAWAGLPCLVGPVTTPASGFPTDRTTGYSMWLSPTTVVESSNGATRTTTTTYDTADRVQTVAVSTSGLTGAAAVPTTRTTYDTATGAVSKIEAVNASNAVVSTISYEHDAWSRQTKYTNATGQATDTTYDAAGRVSSITDPNGSTTYTYDGTDALGHTERRGQTTGVTHTTGSRTFTLTGAYDANGTLTTQGAPGGVTQTLRTNPAGVPIEQFVTGPITDPDTMTTTTGTWLGWSTLRDPLGRIALESTPVGAVLDGSDTTTEDGTGGVGDGYGYERAFHYDALSRLVRVDDLTASTHLGTVTAAPEEDEVSAPGVCQTRTYTFDANSNRTALKTTPCGNPAGTTTTWAYNSGDAATTGANGVGTYSYDQFGRQILLPQADTPMGINDIALGYYDDDAPRLITSGTTTTTFTLDAVGRRLTQTTTGVGPLPGDATPKPAITRHYGDDSDNPAWISYDTGTTTRYLSGIGGDLGISTTSTTSETTAEITIANPHGDVVTTIPIPATGNVTGITAWSDYTEYGTPRNQTATTQTGGPLGYGWLGTKERATGGETFGLTLMGVRFYNPITGRFTSTDPIYGGNQNTYTYPVDPIDLVDVDGMRPDVLCKCGGKIPLKIGFTGEALVRFIYGFKKNYKSYGGVIPDGVEHDKKLFHEVKNVKKQSWTRQLRIMAEEAKKRKYKFRLYVGPNTTLTKGVTNAEKDGLVKIIEVWGLGPIR